MIKEKDLQELRPQVQCKKGTDITLHGIQRTLQNLMEERGIVAAFYTEQVKCGGLLGTTDNCLVLYHPEHQNDYFSIAIRVRQEKNSVALVFNSFGTSKLLKAELVRKQILSTAKVGLDRAADIHKDYNILNDAASGAAYVGAAFVGIRHLVKGNSDKEKMEHEQQWYSAICQLFDEITF